MSGTPIFEQLCQDYVEAGKAGPGDVILPVATQLTVPSLSDPDVRNALRPELDDHLPLAPGELTCSGD